MASDRFLRPDRFINPTYVEPGCSSSGDPRGVTNRGASGVKPAYLRNDDRHRGEHLVYYTPRARLPDGLRTRKIPLYGLYPGWRFVNSGDLYYRYHPDTPVMAFIMDLELIG